MQHSHAETLRATIVLTGYVSGVSLKFRDISWLLQEEGKIVSRIQYTLSQLDYIDKALYSGDSGVYCVGLILLLLGQTNLIVSNAPEDLRSTLVQNLCASRSLAVYPAVLRRDWWRRADRSCLCSALCMTSRSRCS